MGWKLIDRHVCDESFAAFQRDFRRKARFLIDESLGVEATRAIRGLGWNTVYVDEVGPSGKSDHVYEVRPRKDHRGIACARHSCG
jgi:hypothetical protein